MTDRLLTDEDCEEALSRAYAEVIAAGAGYVVGTMNFDRDGVDIEIKAGGDVRPAIALQLKGTINLGTSTNGRYRYALKRRNYDLLRIPTQVPRLLLVLDLPRDQADWFSVTPEELVLRRSSYWVSLLDEPETNNASTITVSIPSANRFDITSLRQLMVKSRTGEKL